MYKRSVKLKIQNNVYAAELNNWKYNKPKNYLKHTTPNYLKSPPPPPPLPQFLPVLGPGTSPTVYSTLHPSRIFLFLSFPPLYKSHLVVS